MHIHATMLWQLQDHRYHVQYNCCNTSRVPTKELYYLVFTCMHCTHTQSHTEQVWALQTQQIVPYYPHCTKVVQVYKVTHLGLHMASMTKMATRKNYCRGKNLSGTFVSKSKVIKGPDMK